MVWMLLVLIAIIVLAVVAVVRHRHTPIPPADPDPLFFAGIALSGTSAALIAVFGMTALPMTIVGIVCIAVGARRSRVRHP